MEPRTGSSTVAEPGQRKANVSGSDLGGSFSGRGSVEPRSGSSTAAVSGHVTKGVSSLAEQAVAVSGSSVVAKNVDRMDYSRFDHIIDSDDEGPERRRSSSDEASGGQPDLCVFCEQRYAIKEYDDEWVCQVCYNDLTRGPSDHG